MSISPEDAATLQSYGEAVEAIRSETERKWGAGRLDRLAALHNPDLLTRFRRQQANWSAAYQRAWNADVLTSDVLMAAQARGAAMRRAWEALDAWASEAGHRPVAPWVWEVRLEDGSVAALVETDEAAAKVIADGRALSVYTAREIGHVIDALPKALQLAKATWQGAKFKGPSIPYRGDEWREDGDPIPFGDDAPPGGTPQSQPPERRLFDPKVAEGTLPNDWREDFA